MGDPSPLEARVSWSGRLPITWRALESMPGEEELARIHERNQALLGALALIEEHSSRPAAEEPSPLVQQMERLEAKLDLVLALFSEVLLPESSAPPDVEVRLGYRAMRFASELFAPEGTIVEVECYFNAVLPRPVILHGIVRESGPAAAGQMTIEFEGLPLAVRERLERLVFRRHRRSIAQQRPRNTEPTPPAAG